MAGDRSRVALCPSDLNELEALLSARPTPLTLEDVRVGINLTDGKWCVYDSVPTMIYCMSWSTGVWVEP